MFDQTNFWRETQRPARFLCFDSRIVIFAGLALIHARIWTIGLLIAAAALSLILERRGIDPGNIPRHLRTYFAGPLIRARRREHLRTPVPLFEGSTGDFGKAGGAAGDIPNTHH